MDAASSFWESFFSLRQFLNIVPNDLIEVTCLSLILYKDCIGKIRKSQQITGESCLKSYDKTKIGLEIALKVNYTRATQKPEQVFGIKGRIGWNEQFYIRIVMHFMPV